MQAPKSKRKSPSTDKVMLAVRLPASTVALLKTIARQNRRPVSWQADIALLTGLGRQPKEKA